MVFSDQANCFLFIYFSDFTLDVRASDWMEWMHVKRKKDSSIRELKYTNQRYNGTKEERYNIVRKRKKRE
jgi:hypothetical protein